eukprot:Skav222904  [mRNA]  locus=scaffold1489:122486:124776:- [translate_table: standard]
MTSNQSSSFATRQASMALLKPSVAGSKSVYSMTSMMSMASCHRPPYLQAFKASKKVFFFPRSPVPSICRKTSTDSFQALSLAHPAMAHLYASSSGSISRSFISSKRYKPLCHFFTRSQHARIAAEKAGTPWLKVVVFHLLEVAQGLLPLPPSSPLDDLFLIGIL